MKLALVITLFFLAFVIEALSQCSDDEHDKEIAHNATGLWNSEENKLDDYFKVTCIEKVESSLVGGMLYTIKLSIGQTECALSDELILEDVDDCDLKSDGQTLNCEFEVFEEFQSENPYKLNSAKCQDQTTQVEPTDEDSNDVKDGKEEENSDEVLDAEKDKEDEDENDNDDEDDKDDDKEDKEDDKDDKEDDTDDEDEDKDDEDEDKDDKGEDKDEDDKEEDKDDDIDDN